MFLGHVGNVEPRNLRCVQARDVAPVEVDAALRGLPQAHDGAQRGRLARAIAAQQHGELALGDGEIHAVQDVVRPDVRVHAWSSRRLAVLLMRPPSLRPCRRPC